MSVQCSDPIDTDVKICEMQQCYCPGLHSCGTRNLSVAMAFRQVRKTLRSGRLTLSRAFFSRNNCSLSPYENICLIIALRVGCWGLQTLLFSTHIWGHWLSEAALWTGWVSTLDGQRWAALVQTIDGCCTAEPPCGYSSGPSGRAANPLWLFMTQHWKFVTVPVCMAGELEIVRGHEPPIAFDSQWPSQVPSWNFEADTICVL